MSFLQHSLSDSSFVANSPNGSTMDLQHPCTCTSSSVSPVKERRHSQPLSAAASSSSGCSLFSSLSSAMKQIMQAVSGLMETLVPPVFVIQKPKILLVVDDAHTDRARYSYGKKMNGEIEIRVEQVSKSQLTRYLGLSLLRSFKPIQQHIYSMTLAEEYFSLVIGLQYGRLPSVNSLYSIYNFRSKPRFSQLIKIFNSLGPEKFPLVEHFLPNHKQMVSTSGFA
uniref:Synapsin III n=1 Tax=Vombatus ursinus TaxID=29139 RepID=A0A4X2K2Q4_VOMUR